MRLQDFLSQISDLFDQGTRMDSKCTFIDALRCAVLIYIHVFMLDNSIQQLSQGTALLLI